MVAVRKFDEDATIQSAMEVFWRQGYERTSIDDLEAATGVKRGSLYNAYGGKEEIFLMAFDRYCREIQDRLLEGLDTNDTIEAAMSSVLETQINALESGDLPPGCLIANSLTEFGNSEGPLGEAVRARMEKTETVLYDRFRQAQSEGQFPPGIDLRALARYMVTIMSALPTQHRARGDGRAIRDIAEMALSVFRGSAI